MVVSKVKAMEKEDTVLIDRVTHLRISMSTGNSDLDESISLITSYQRLRRVVEPATPNSMVSEDLSLIHI